MPYCIVADSEVSAPTTGVRRVAVEELACDGLRCFYSTFAQQPESFTQEDALQFYGTVQTVFERVAVIPFRFPTLLEAKPQLEEFLAGKAQDYAATLAKLQDFVQMELRILPQGGQPASSTSGKDYMAQRLKSKQALESAAQAARAALGALSANWRQQETREGLRCYGLVARHNTALFQEKMKSFAVDDDVRVFVTGPWPATEFIE